MKLSVAQFDVLMAIKNGKPFCEFMTPDPRQLAFRTLGEYVPAKLNYVLDGKRIRYRTFWVLFKHNFIYPSKYKAGLSPQNGIKQFHLTARGLEVVVRRRKR
jgi:hypothetical protein